LVFGGAGFIGTNLTALLLSGGHQVHVFDNLLATGSEHLLTKVDTFFECDMLDTKQVELAIRNSQPDRIYHLAANSDISASAINPEHDLRNTLLTTQSLLLAMDRTGTSAPLVFASSSAVYGEKHGLIHEDVTCNPLSSYGWMKLASENLIQHYFNQGLISKGLIARFPNVTGEYQTHGVVHDLVKRALSGVNPLIVLGDGSQTKPYVLASELAGLLEKYIATIAEGKLVTANISPADRASVSQIATWVVERVNPTLSIRFGEKPSGWPGDVNSYELDCSLAEEQLGGLRFGDSESALKTAIDWAIENLSD